MSEKEPKPKDRAKLDVETILQTTEGRSFLNNINSVSQVLAIVNSTVEFKGEEIVKTGYVGDCKSVHLFKCPNGYFLFCNKAFTMNNWSTTGTTVDEVIAKTYDNDIKKRIKEEISALSDFN